jgi:hypothetical protein
MVIDRDGVGVGVLLMPIRALSKHRDAHDSWDVHQDRIVAAQLTWEWSI